MKSSSSHRTLSTSLVREPVKQVNINALEADIIGLSADERLAARIEHTKSKLKAFERWLAQSRAQISAKPPTSEALKYIAKYWAGLNLFLTDGRIEIDNKPAFHRTIPSKVWKCALTVGRFCNFS